MRTLAKIFGTLVILFALLACSMSIYRAQRDKDKLEAQLTEARQQIEEYKSQATTMTGAAKTYLDEQIATAEKTLQEAPSASTYQIVQVFLSVLLALSVAYMVLLFRPNRKLVLQLLIGSIVVAFIVYFASPDIKRGQYSGMDSRTLALLSGIPVVLAGLLALAVAKVAVAKQ